MAATGLTSKREVIERGLRTLTQTFLCEASNAGPDNIPTVVRFVSATVTHPAMTLRRKRRTGLHQLLRYLALADQFEDLDSPPRVRDRRARPLGHVRG